ncbi:type VI secretion system Vgr family protein [Paraburkholderia unamae]|nr:type VI secretion system Vgr family protein [Paraburkholderia unamae]
MSIDGPALPRFTPPGPRPDWYYRVHPSATSEDVTQCVLVPIHLHGREALGECYRYTVRMRTDVRVPSVPDIITLDLDKVVGTEVTISIDVPGRGTFIPGMPGDTGRGNIGFHVREISGRIGAARFIRRDNRSMVYEFDIEPALMQAALGQNYRNFQDRTVIEAIEELLAPYPTSIDWRIGGPSFSSHYPRLDLQRQYWESDYTCFRRWCERAGLFYWFEHSGGFHRLVIADTMGAFHAHGEAYETLRYAPGENRIEEEHIERLEVISRQTEGKATAVDHDYMTPRNGPWVMPLRGSDVRPRWTAQADQEFYEQAKISQPLQGSMGLSGQPLDLDRQAQQVALVRMQSLNCLGLRAKGSGHLRGLRTGFTFEVEDHPIKTANQEWLVIATTLTIECNDQTSGTEQVFKCDCQFEVQPSYNCHYRLPIVTQWPVAHTEIAIVTGYDEREIWTDAQGRVKVQFVADRNGTHDENSSVWLRVAQPWQYTQMGAAFVPRVGSEVLVEHINGDPDMPFVSGSVTNRYNTPAWALPHNQWVSALRSKEQDGQGSNHVALDDTHGKQQAQLASDHAKSSLSLGYITRIDGNKGRQDERGIGAEIRTDGQATVRAAQGVFLTTDGRPNAQGKVKENGEAVSRLTAARDIHESMAREAQRHFAQDATGDQGDVVDSIRDANAALRGNGKAGLSDFPEFENPDIAISSAANVHMAASASSHIASGHHTAFTAGKHLSVATGQSFFASVRSKIAFYAKKAMTFVTPGPVRIQSQADNVDLIARKVLNLLSEQDEIRLTGRRIVLNGSGTQFVIGPEGVIGKTNGVFLVHAASHATSDPEDVPVKTPITDIADAKVVDHYVLPDSGSGLAMSSQRYRIRLDDGQLIEGVSSERGETSLVMSQVMQIAEIKLLRNDGSVMSIFRPMLTKDAETANKSSGTENA